MLVRTAAALALLFPPVAALAEEPSGIFLELAGRLPLETLAAEPGTFVHLADVEAARRAAGGDADPLAPWMRVGSPPLGTSLVAGLEGAWTPRVGFGPDEVEAAVTVLVPPRRGLVLRLDPAAAERVGPTLLASGYEAVSRDGLDALAHGEEDLAVSLADRDPVNPLGGDLGMSGRATLLGPDLLWSNEWPMLLDLAREPSPDPRLDAVAGALDLPDWGGAELLQAVLWLNPLDFASAPPPGLLDLDPARQQELMEELLGDEAAGIPPWSLGVLADMSAEDGALALVLFVYGDQASADQAAETLALTFPEAQSMMTRRSWAEITGATASTLVTGDGPFVTVLALRGPAEADGHAFRALLRGWQARDLPFFGPA